MLFQENYKPLSTLLMTADTSPSHWVARFSEDADGSVLDLACGGGRHSRHFLALGCHVTAVDRDTSQMADIADHPHLTLVEADLEAEPPGWRPDPRSFAIVVVTNYLWRPLLPVLIDAVAPGGRLVYETFARGNERFGKPSNPDFLLVPSELRDAVADELEVLAFEEGETDEPRPAVIQRICAIRAEN